MWLSGLWIRFDQKYPFPLDEARLDELSPVPESYYWTPTPVALREYPDNTNFAVDLLVSPPASLDVATLRGLELTDPDDGRPSPRMP